MQPVSANRDVGVFSALFDSRAWLMAVMAVMLLTMPGCGGCRSKPPKTAAQKKKEAEERKKKEEEAKKEQEKKKRKPDFEATPLRFEPADPQTAFNYYKPGHWVATEQGIRANNFDFAATVVQKTVGVADQKPVLIDGTNYHLTTKRPAALAKGQARFVESLCLAPPASKSRNFMVSTNLLQSRAQNEVFSDTGTATRMKEYQYIFLVLSSMPDNFTFVKTLPSIEPTVVDDSDQNATFYRVVAPRIDRDVSVPSHSLAWSSIAYVLWDRVNPDLMTSAQKQAMIDWLHWGGQLIINGPDNLDALKSTFLSDYLPCDHVGAAEFTVDDFQEMNEYFSLYSDKRKKVMAFELLDDEKLLGVEWKLRPEGQEVPSTGGMVAERTVGRGRIVTTAFSLASRHFKRWGSADNFFNCCLLRRPGRDYESASTFSLKVSFNGVNTWDPRLGSNVRYLSRDLPPLAGYGDASFAEGGAEGVAVKETPATREKFEGYGAWDGVGNAGWNDESGISNAARQALRTAAGISVLKADAVMKAVGVYLLFLVPLNWLLFRLIGRVEWAWVAAPVIAVVGSVFVIRYAQLDIGFDRSLTEAAVVELQPGYARGHLTRYTALYASLATNYEMVMDDPSSVAVPFPSDVNEELRIHERVREVTLNRGSKIALTNFQVISNFTGMLHSEQMCEFGVISLREAATGLVVTNGAAMTLRDVMVIRRKESGELEKCFLGRFEPEISRPLEWQPIPNDSFAKQFPEWQHSECSFANSAGDVGEASLRDMAVLACRQLAIRVGECRLIGWTDVPMPGVATNPTPAKASYRTMVVAQLKRELPGKPDKDRKLLIDLMEVERQSIDTLLEDQPKGDSPIRVPN